MAYLYTTYIQCTMYFLDEKHLKFFVKKKMSIKELRKRYTVFRECLTCIRYIVHHYDRELLLTPNFNQSGCITKCLSLYLKAIFIFSSLAKSFSTI